MKRLRIVSVASEVAPFSKTGGLGDVTRSLPKSLKRLGHDVIVITPLYKQLIDVERLGLKKIHEAVTITVPNVLSMPVDYYRGELMRGLPIYFVGCDQYFGKKKTLYGSDIDNKRFYFFDVAALKLILLLQFSPDIIHCHDWHAGLIPELLKKQFAESETLKRAATVFTIHNLAFQLGHNWWEIPGHERDNGRAPLPDIDDSTHMERVNFTKRAILNADIVNAVSETYAEEILEKHFGEDLHRILQARKNKLFGVVNGIDYRDFDPARDTNLALTYSHAKPHRKKINKEALQKYFGLEKDPDTCLIVMTSRMTEQKGFDIVLPIIPALMEFRMQFLFLGDGDKEYQKQIAKLAKQYPRRIALGSYATDAQKETLLYAGGDLSLFPSRFEPCGTGQLKSMRYGCIPIAREIGGLSDTVIDIDANGTEGNGFVFKDFDSYGLLSAISRAYAHSRNHTLWRSFVVRAMKQSNSWELPARKYVELYKKALKFKNGNG